MISLCCSITLIGGGVERAALWLLQFLPENRRDGAIATAGGVAFHPGVRPLSLFQSPSCGAKMTPRSFYTRLRESLAIGHLRVRIRLKLLDALAATLLPKYSRIQPGLIRSLVGMYVEPASCPNLQEWHREYPASVERFDLPSEFPPAFHRDYAFQAVYTYCLRDVLVGVKSGHCFTNAGVIFGESGLSNAWEGIQRTPLDVLTGACVKRFTDAQTVTVVHCNIYYHFLLDELPRLLRTLRRYPNAQLVACESAPAYLWEVLDHLQRRGAVTSPPCFLPEGVIRAERYVFSAAYHDRFVRIEDLRLLRAQFAALTSSGGPRRRVYVSRHFSARPFDNEAQIEAVVTELGLSVVYLERLPWMEQVALFASAELIVAAHGGGLANLVWSAPGTQVIELLQQEHFNDCFSHLACQLDLRYRYLFSRKGEGKWGSVDLCELKALVDPISTDVPISKP